MNASREPSYAAEALWLPTNWIMFIGVSLFALSAAEPRVLLLTVPAEALWLLVAPRTPAFRAWVDRRRRREEQNEIEDRILSAYDKLDSAYSSRLAAVGRLLEDIREPRGLADERQLEPALHDLEELRSSFLKMCELHQRLTRVLAESPAADMEREKARLTQAFAQEKDLGMRLTLRQALNLAQKQLEQREQVSARCRNLEVRMKMIEDSLLQLRRQRASMAPAHEIENEVQQVLAQAASIAALEAESSDALSTRGGVALTA